MRLLLLVAVCLGASAHSLPLNLTDMPANAIIDAQPGTLRQFPYVVYIEPYCIGALLSDSHVVTHHSCVRELRVSSKVYAGVLSVNNLNAPNVQQSEVKTTAILAQPFDLSTDYAIGIITLTTPFKLNAFVKTAYVVSNDDDFTVPGDNKGVPVQTVSYGNADQWNLKLFLKYVNVQIFESKDCSARWSDFDGTWGICTGMYKAEDYIFPFDEGAPLVTGGNILIGITVYRGEGGLVPGGFHVRLARHCLAIQNAIGRPIGCSG